MVNKPSQDLLGLTLHPIDPVDESTGAIEQQPPKEEVAIGGGLDVSVLSGTSKEVTDIFGEFGADAQPQLPPKQMSLASTASSSTTSPPTTTTATGARPSSVQRERISSSLKAIPRPPSRHGSVITSGSATISGRVRTTPSPIPSSLFGDNKLSLLVRQDSNSSAGGE
jgi:hypothetical protein